MGEERPKWDRAAADKQKPKGDSDPDNGRPHDAPQVIQVHTQCSVLIGRLYITALCIGAYSLPRFGIDYRMSIGNGPLTITSRALGDISL